MPESEMDMNTLKTHLDNYAAAKKQYAAQNQAHPAINSHALLVVKNFLACEMPDAARQVAQAAANTILQNIDDLDE